MLKPKTETQKAQSHKMSNHCARPICRVCKVNCRFVFHFWVHLEGFEFQQQYDKTCLHTWGWQNIAKAWIIKPDETCQQTICPREKLSIRSTRKKHTSSINKKNIGGKLKNWKCCAECVIVRYNLHENREYKSLQSLQEWKCRC